MFTLHQIIYTKYSLKFHIGRHTGKKPFLWTCCCKPFSHRYYLTRHMPSHNGEKPYSCVICNKLFFTKKWCEDTCALSYRCEAIFMFTMQQIIFSSIFSEDVESYWQKTPTSVNCALNHLHIRLFIFLMLELTQRKNLGKHNHSIWCSVFLWSVQQDSVMHPVQFVYRFRRF